MTRINCVPPDELSRQHLVAEYHELPRVFTMVRKAHAEGRWPYRHTPSRYRLGVGHVTFFTDKLGYLCERYARLCAEMHERGYKVNFPEPDTTGCPVEAFGYWIPDAEALALNRQRIKERP